MVSIIDSRNKQQNLSLAIAQLIFYRDNMGRPGGFKNGGLVKASLPNRQCWKLAKRIVVFLFNLEGKKAFEQKLKSAS